MPYEGYENRTPAAWAVLDVRALGLPAAAQMAIARDKRVAKEAAEAVLAVLPYNNAPHSKLQLYAITKDMRIGEYKAHRNRRLMQGLTSAEWIDGLSSLEREFLYWHYSFGIVPGGEMYEDISHAGVLKALANWLDELQILEVQRGDWVNTPGSLGQLGLKKSVMTRLDRAKELSTRSIQEVLEMSTLDPGTIQGIGPATIKALRSALEANLLKVNW